MRAATLQARVENRGLVLDPRTKLFLMLTISLFLLGMGLDNVYFFWLRPVLCCVPLVLLLSAHRFRAALIYTVAYSVSYLAFVLLGPLLTGVLNFIVLASSGIFTRFMPTIAVGVYLLTTTTVSEFTAALQRMHVSEKVIIPLSVMFRFFPTVADEATSITDAMRLRGVSFAGGNPVAMLEYRVIPMIMCTAKIGEELSAAALTRGLGGTVKRTNICEIGFHAADIVVMAFCLVPYACFAFTLVGGA